MYFIFFNKNKGEKYKKKNCLPMLEIINKIICALEN